MLTKRIEEYQTKAGLWTQSKSEAVRVTHEQLLEAVHGIGTTIRDSYWSGTADHETNGALNERDTEISGFQTWGVYQVSRAEARAMRAPDANLLKLDGNTLVMIRLAERARIVLRMACNLIFPDDPDPHDLPGYLAIAHNLGLFGHGGALESVIQHGLDFGEYERRNPTLRVVASGYGRSCIGS
jgi:hypothetical protein